MVVVDLMVVVVFTVVVVVFVVVVLNVVVVGFVAHCPFEQYSDAQVILCLQWQAEHWVATLGGSHAAMSLPVHVDAWSPEQLLLPM